MFPETVPLYPNCLNTYSLTAHFTLSTWQIPPFERIEMNGKIVQKDGQSGVMAEQLQKRETELLQEINQDTSKWSVHCRKGHERQHVAFMLLWFFPISSLSCVLIESDTDDEPFPAAKRARVSKNGSKDEILVSSDTDESSVIVIDDDSDEEFPVIQEEDPYEKGQIISTENEKEDVALSECTASDYTGEQYVGEQLVSDPENKLKISDVKTVTNEEFMGESPKNFEIKDTCVKRVCKARKGFKPSTEKNIKAKCGNSKNELEPDPNLQ